MESQEAGSSWVYDIILRSGGLSRLSPVVLAVPAEDTAAQDEDGVGAVDGSLTPGLLQVRR